ncbi:MAG: hypothetical protein IJT73_07150 [Selenomonadaceae bacterium]|nr:hypothetical protein [Selenomonadaceae bacterium]
MMNRGNLYNALFSNALSLSQQQANLQNALFANQMAKLNAQEQLYNQLLNNAYGAYDRAEKAVLDNYGVISDFEKSKLDNLTKAASNYDRWLERLLQIYEADYQKKFANIDF